MISIVIPAYNEEKNIRACLEALTQQTTQEPFEVIVVDNNSQDNTREKALAFSDRLDIRVINEQKQGRGAARALGFREARGDVILSTDADTRVPPSWVAVFAAVVQDRQYAAATGIARIDDCGWWTNTVFNLFLPLLIRFNRLLYGHVGLSGYGFSIRKETYLAAGGFDPQTDAYEDLDLGLRVGKLGPIKLITSPAITFSGRRFQGGLLKGCGEYLRTWREKFLRKKRHVVLSNIK